MAVIPVAGWEVAVALISVAAGSYIAVWIAARIYRTGMLMYGKRPTLRELARWLRTA
jgi:ABC-2 type transport system permease protein